MKKAVLGFAVVLLAATAYAGNQNDAGCGVGSMIFKDNTAGQQILAATTNGISGNQTFGITTGTLGCSEGGLLKAEKQREVYIAANFRTLAAELAAGQGEYASTLATVMGCKQEVVPTFLSYAKTNYGGLFPTPQTSVTEFQASLEAGIAKDPVLSQSCAL